MNLPEPQGMDFSEVLARLPTSQIWQYDSGRPPTRIHVPQAVVRALQTPLDFPPIRAAIVPQDRIALAVDPNVPELEEVIQGVMDALSQTTAGAIDIVLWEEATERTVESLSHRFGELATITRHQSDERSSLRYLAADEAGEAIYLNRLVVDADFALPIIAHRAMDQFCQHDLTGIYPSMCDAATRYRHQIQMSQPEQETSERNEEQIPWLLGVNLMLAVKSNTAGHAGEIVAGTPPAVGKQVFPVRRATDDYPPSASLVIASLDGNAQQQTWQNAARAAVAASRYVQPGGTIVLWTAIDVEPSGSLLSLDQFDEAEIMDDDAGKTLVDEHGKFPQWLAEDGIASSLSRIANDFRLLLHSGLATEAIESMGIGCIQDVDELSKLCGSFDSCGILQAAQFASSTIDAPHRLETET